MNTTLAVVVSAIVVLITALVVLTIFSSTIGNFSTITQAKTWCASTYISSCQISGGDPPLWNTKNIRVGDQVMSCADAGTGCTCDAAARRATCAG